MRRSSRPTRVRYIILALTVGAINPVFFSIFNIFSLLKNSTVIGLFAIGFFLVLVTGGLDVSFAAVGVTAGVRASTGARSERPKPRMPNREALIMSVPETMDSGLILEQDRT